ncbi:MAG: sensor histidine kinase [bacterium]|nr:sensor histidine kinase [bacterium]
MSGDSAYQSLFATVPLGILQLDPQGQVLEINPVLSALFDLPLDLSQAPAGEWSFLEYRPFQECGIPAYFSRVVQAGRPFVSEGSCTTAGGDRIHVRYFLNPLDGMGVVTGPENPEAIRSIQCIVVDLTGLTGSAREVRKIYARFDSIVSNISPVVTLDGDYRIQFANRTFRQEFLENPSEQDLDIPGAAQAPQAGEDPPVGDPECLVDEEENPGETGNEDQAPAEENDPTGVEGRSLFEIFAMSRAHEEVLRANVEASSSRVVENCEFKSSGRIVGYTIFRFGEQIGLILKDISRIKKLEEKVVRLHSRLLHLQERERQVVARELHDGVGQTILAAKLNFTSYEKNPEQFEDRFQVGLDLIDRASQELRDLYTRLYPSVLNDLGLEAAIRWYSKVFLEIKNIDVELEIQLGLKIPRPVETHLFRIVQELFTNIVKHSGAERVRLQLEDREADVLLIVKDDGRGFSPDAVRLNLRGFGLDNIRRRIDDLDGTLRITAEPGEGTCFEITVPVD